MARTLLKSIDHILTVDPQNTVLDDGSIVVENDRILAIGPAEQIDRQFAGATFDRVIDGRRRAIMPGLIDCHVHLSEQLSRSLFPDNLSTRPWIYNWGKPWYAAVNEEDEEVGTLVAAVEMIRSGTTCCLDMGAQNNPGAVARSIKQAGTRVCTGRHAADIKPETIPWYWTEEMVAHHFFDSAKEALPVLRKCVEDWHGSAEGRVRCWVNIEGNEPCTGDLFYGVSKLAAEMGVGSHYHLATTIEQSLISERKFGAWPITRLTKLGALRSNVVLAHAVAVKDEEVKMLADQGTKVTFCPGTALKVAKGATKIGKYPEMVEAGVNLALGCDGVCAAGSLDMLRQMYLVAGLFKDCRMDADLVPAVEAVRMATINGARAVLWEDEIGSLEAGKKADLLVFDVNHIEWTPCHDPVNAAVYSATPASLHSVMVNGRWLMEDRKILTLNEADVLEEARRRAKEILARSGLKRGVTPTKSTLYD